MSSTAAQEGQRATGKSDGETLAVEIAAAIGSVCPPLFQFLGLFGSDPLLWLGIIAALHGMYYAMCPRHLVFLLPYPLGYGMPAYMSLVSVQRPQDIQMRMVWLSFWACVVFIDLSELLLLGPVARSLRYYPLVKLLVLLALLCETTDYTRPAEIDKAEEARLKAEARHARKLLEAEGASKDKIDGVRREKNKEVEAAVAKTKSRKKRYNCFMIVEPFLPPRAAATGPKLDYSTVPKPRERDKSTRQLVYTLVEQADKQRERALKQKEYYRKRMQEGSGLGNWKEPVAVWNGKVVSHNPIVDDFGQAFGAFVHGDQGKVDFGTPWDADKSIDPHTTTRTAEIPLDGSLTERGINENRIHFRGAGEWTDYEKDPREGDIQLVDPSITPEKRERGIFTGYTGRSAAEVANLQSGRVNLHQSVNRFMLGQDE